MCLGLAAVDACGDLARDGGLLLQPNEHGRSAEDDRAGRTRDIRPQEGGDWPRFKTKSNYK